MTSNMGFALFLFALALLLAGLGWHLWRGDRENVRLAAAAGAWPTTPGLVQSSQVIKHVSTRRDTENNQDIEQYTYEPTVSYAYAVGNTQFAGNRLSFKRAHYISDKKAIAAIAKFPEGAAVAVAYDPADPQNSVLDRDTKPSAVSLWTAMIGITAIVVAGLGVVMLTLPG